MESMRAWQRLEDYSRERDRKKTLRIAVLARHCSDVIIPAVVTIMKRHEETLRVTMDVHASRDIHYSKYSHPFDVGFGTLLSSHDDLEKTALAHLPFCLVASRQHSIARYDTIGQEDCREAEFVILSRDTLEQEHTRRLMPARSLHRSTCRQECLQRLQAHRAQGAAHDPLLCLLAQSRRAH